MKLSKADLTRTFTDKKFEVKTTDLYHQRIKFNDKFVTCILSSLSTDFGYQVSGTYSARVEYDCDRCATPFEKEVKDSLKFWCVTNIAKVISTDIEVFYMRNDNDILDISSFLSDLISLNRPIKVLCINNCKGICICCGINLNNEICSKNKIKSYHN